MKRIDSFLDAVVPYYQLNRPIDWKGQFQSPGNLVVEIGFGHGEVLIRTAKESKDKNFIGIEQNWERIQKTIKAIHRGNSQLSNKIKILKIDARDAFERLFKPKTIDHIYSLFPCPWPKKEHIKHRLFSQEFLKLLNNRLKENGAIKIVTDYEPYFEWVKEQAKKTGFSVGLNVIDPQFDTKFERKWRAEGQNKFFEIQLKKEKHQKVEVKKDVVLKTYKIKQFDPQRVQLKDEITDKITVVFKQMLFDPKAEKMMILSIVVENHLTQQFWIAISKKDSFWRIYKADGQHFFPTPGIARALELVYESVQ